MQRNKKVVDVDELDLSEETVQHTPKQSKRRRVLQTSTPVATGDLAVTVTTPPRHMVTREDLSPYVGGSGNDETPGEMSGITPEQSLTKRELLNIYHMMEKKYNVDER